MIECCHRKAVRMKISIVEACKIFDAEDGWDIEDVISTINEVCEKQLWGTRIRQAFLDAIKTIPAKKEYEV